MFQRAIGSGFHCLLVVNLNYHISVFALGLAFLSVDATIGVQYSWNIFSSLLAFPHPTGNPRSPPLASLLASPRCPVLVNLYAAALLSYDGHLLMTCLASSWPLRI